MALVAVATGVRQGECVLRAERLLRGVGRPGALLLRYSLVGQFTLSVRHELGERIDGAARGAPLVVPARSASDGASAPEGIDDAR